jgi:hypothetical protein
MGARRAALAVRLMAGIVFACAAVHTVLAQDAPASYASVQEAQDAAKAAKAAHEQASQQYRAEMAECSKTFFTNHCTDAARKRRDDAVAASDKVRQKSDLYTRQTQARERREKLDADNARRDARNAEKNTSRQAAPKPSAPADPKKPVPPKPAVPPTPRAIDDPTVRARNREAYEAKQEEARVYAQQKAEQRKQAEDKRVVRRAQRAADEAKLNNSGKTPPVDPSMAK